MCEIMSVVDDDVHRQQPVRHGLAFPALHDASEQPTTGADGDAIARCAQFARNVQGIARSVCETTWRDQTHVIAERVQCAISPSGGKAVVAPCGYQHLVDTGGAIIPVPAGHWMKHVRGVPEQYWDTIDRIANADHPFDARTTAMELLTRAFDDAWPALDAAGRRERLICCQANDLRHAIKHAHEYSKNFTAPECFTPFPIYPGSGDEHGGGFECAYAESCIDEHVSGEEIAASESIRDLLTVLRERTPSATAR
jgi:hypothetical protein